MKSPEGYNVEPASLRRRALGIGEEGEFLWEVYGELSEAFLREGRPLGDDQYGAELEKNLPRTKERIFDAFKAYIEEVEGVGDGLHVSAVTYEASEDASTLPSSPGV